MGASNQFIKKNPAPRFVKLPSEAECEKLLERYATSSIRRHVARVRDVGVFLAKQLEKKGVDIDVELVSAACLLHDLMKLATFESLDPQPAFGFVPTPHEIATWKEMRERYKGMHETQITASVLRGDFPEFAEFIAELGSTQDPRYFAGSLEIKLVHYADSRVQSDTIVALRERLAYLEKKYASEEQRALWEERVAKELALENEIFLRLDIAPENLGDLDRIYEQE
jgi:hypothetical protein